MVSVVKWLLVAWLSIMVVASEENLNRLKKDEVWVCVRWIWTSTPIDGRVNCV